MRLLLLALATFLGTVAAGSASADAIGECIETALEERGYDPGLADGVIDADAAAAAESFSSAGGFPMPPLDRANAEEWCAVLRGWDERQSGPSILLRRASSFDGLNDLANPDPAALPRGIFFAPSVSIELRSMVIDDLNWLAERGELAGSDELATLLQVPGPLTGAVMIDWLVEHLMAIATPAEGCFETWLKAVPVAVVPYCDDVGEGGDVSAFAGERAAPVAASRAILRHLDNAVVVTPVDQSVFAPVAYLDPNGDFWQVSGDTAAQSSTRLGRLAILFHEAAHIAFGTKHWPCRGSTPTSFLLEDEPDHDFCDENIYASANMVGGLVAAVLAQNCDGCGFIERHFVYANALREMFNVLVPLRVPAITPATTFLAAYGFARVPYAFVVPEAYFDVAAIQLQAFLADEECPCGNAWDTYPARLEEMRQLAETPLFAGNLGAPWRIERRPPGKNVPDLTGWGNVWLARASAAAADGYNVPLRWVVDCDEIAQTGVSCDVP